MEAGTAFENTIVYINPKGEVVWSEEWKKAKAKTKAKAKNENKPLKGARVGRGSAPDMKSEEWRVKSEKWRVKS